MADQQPDSSSLMKFCGVDFPNKEPRHLWPEGTSMEDATAQVKVPVCSDDVGLAIFTVGETREFVGSTLVIPFQGKMDIPGEGIDTLVVLVNQWGEERAARFIFYEQTVDVKRETWVGLVAFEDDERALTLARYCRSEGIALPNAHENAPPSAILA